MAKFRENSDSRVASRTVSSEPWAAPPIISLWKHSALDLETNLALDEAHLQAVEEGELPPSARLWEWPHPAVVLGASGRIREDVRLDACARDGVPLARRSSGGGTVLLGPGTLCLTIVLPIAVAPGLDAVDRAQVYVLECLARTLRRCGLPITVEGSGDLALHDRKTAGSAQRRLRHHFMIHSSILYGMDIPAVTRYLAMPRRQPSYREGRTHADFLVNLPLTLEGLTQAIEATWAGPSPRYLVSGLLPWERAKRLVEGKFADPEWVWRF